MFRKKGIICLSLIVLVSLIMAVNRNSCAEVVNSIVARVNDHIITLRDLEIEYSIREKIEKELMISKRELVEEMINSYLLEVEMLRIPQRKLYEKSKEQIEKEITFFEAQFTSNEYDEFLNDLEITKKYIASRFKRKVMIENFLDQKARVKKNGSKIEKNVILSGDVKSPLSSSAEEVIEELRRGAGRIMVNDIKVGN